MKDRNSIWDFILAFNCGLYSLLLVLYVWLPFKFPVWKYVNGYLWGLALGVVIFTIVFDAYLFFKKEKSHD